eukprot:TRINITY_DN21799_c0_g1_i1.p1 TRINITY_DN21799_c0_g1~~TRINITY_DN21799_c0_g1_i1.p1  ORF type:complete len:518 (+),score=100.21 TRINITY_DN21799_c0_g1_i1:72-1625(+)
MRRRAAASARHAAVAVNAPAAARPALRPVARRCAAAEAAVELGGIDDLRQQLAELKRRLKAIEETHDREAVLHNDLEYFSRREVSALDFEKLLRFADCTAEQLVAFAQFVRDEVLIRLAKTRRAMEELPYGLSHMPSIKLVMTWYEESFRNVRDSVHPTSLAEIDALLPALSRILSRHAATLQTVARGVFELKSAMKTASEASGWSERDLSILKKSADGSDSVAEVLMSRFPLLQASLDRFYTRRTGVRFLIAHLLDLCFVTSLRNKWQLPGSRGSDLFYGKRPGTPGYYYGYDPNAFVGIICKEMHVDRIVRIAVDSVIEQARAVLGGCPEIGVHVHAIKPITHIPHTVYTMATELLKNAVRAVADRHGFGEPGKGPPLVNIHVCVSEDRHLTLKVADQGGGIPRSKLSKVMGYLYTTAPQPLYCIVDSTRIEEATGVECLVGDSPGGVGSLPFSGYGYGLPITRQLAEYYQGEFELISQEGVGSDAFVYLPPLERCREHTGHFRRSHQQGTLAWV